MQKEFPETSPPRHTNTGPRTIADTGDTMPLPYRQEISPTVSQARIESFRAPLATAMTALCPPSGPLHPVLATAFRTDDIAPVGDALAALGKDARTIVFFGTGGSSLGGQVLAQLAGWNIPGDRGDTPTPAGTLRRPRTRFYDNLDGRTLANALNGLDLATTRFVITSKSGTTDETLIQAIAAIDALRTAGHGEDLARFVLGVSEPVIRDSGRPRNGLRDLLTAHAIPCLDHPSDIGGRYSGLTVTGMLPALARGLDFAGTRSAARRVVETLDPADPLASPPARGAALIAHLLLNEGIRTFPFVPYADRLARLAHWYVQLFSESLAKAGNGGTPVAALGPVDQHSQLQLWMDGPADQMVTFVRANGTPEGPVIPADLAELAGLEYLTGLNAGALVSAQSHAIPQALTAAGRHHRVIEIETVDAASVGALMMHFMIETILVGRLIGVDPFDQPAVEIGKRLAREKLK